MKTSSEIKSLPLSEKIQLFSKMKMVHYLFRAAIRHRDFPSGVHVENLAVLPPPPKKISFSPQSETNHHRHTLPLSCGHFKTPQKRLRKQETPTRHQHNGFGVQTFRRFSATSHPNTSDHWWDYKIPQQGRANWRGCLGCWKSSMSPPSQWSPDLHTLHGFWREIIVPLDHNDLVQSINKRNCCGYWSQSETIRKVLNADFWGKREGMSSMGNSNVFAFNLVTLVVLLFGG